MQYCYFISNNIGNIILQIIAAYFLQSKDRSSQCNITDYLKGGKTADRTDQINIIIQENIFLISLRILKPLRQIIQIHVAPGNICGKIRIDLHILEKRFHIPVKPQKRIPGITVKHHILIIKNINSPHIIPN